MPTGSQASWCELMAVRAPTVNREWPAKIVWLCHSPTLRVLRGSQVSGGWERRFTTLAGAIHNSEPSIHNLVHDFWQGDGSNRRSRSRDRHSHGCEGRSRACSVVPPMLLFPGRSSVWEDGPRVARWWVWNTSWQQWWDMCVFLTERSTML